LYGQLIAFTQIVNPDQYITLINKIGLKKDLTILASDQMEGRETGTEGQRKAAAYIEKRFSEIGLKYAAGLNGYQQFFPISQDSVMETSLMIDGEKQIFGSDFLTPIALNENDSFVANTMVFAGYGIEDDLYNDYQKIDVKGKVVLILSGEPKKNNTYVISGNEKTSGWSRYGLKKKTETAFKKGAKGVLFVNTNQSSFSPQAIHNSKSIFTFNQNDNHPDNHLKVATISHELAKKIIGVDFNNIIQLAKDGFLLNDISLEKALSISFSIKKITTHQTASNVIGVIEGSDKKDEYVFLTAHYDHLGNQNGIIYNGADDDGSGTVTVLQMAEAFAKAKKEGHGPRRTIVCMTVSGEEKGLWGSEYYSEHPIFRLDKTSVDLNTDMIGRIDTERKKDDLQNYLYVIGHDKISTDLAKIVETINTQKSKLILDYTFDNPSDPNRIFYRSDHYNFAKKGVPILFFYDGMLQADYHQPTDDIDKIEWSLFEKRAQFIFRLAWAMANRNEMLVRDIPLIDTE
jgi:hypothetical protein